ncbi:ketosteroid isomerase-related protein [Rubellimicrobium sp. CFH 75288]|uniref:ketosteroid isomerase-related protein n=1 Tax=Rubellimicrobium sp. CFH 75288 TaxID=2697034 RepID=UPI001413314F|nr:ketosteroid isomerase-related protein [Rubellimicrobium sp. CFH 75288]NAZ37517.1 DUF4440 domain-containing protein [Rubellimicrobium sp. CFH 75288]
MDATALVRAYFDAFNRGDREGMAALVTEDVEHHVNQGGVRHGREAFRAFCERMAGLYEERAEDLVVLTSPEGDRAAAEYTIHGRYLSTDEGLPEARGQSYVLPVGSFFAIRDGRIARVSTHYNVPDWVRQVS